MKTFRLLYITIIVALLVACGGGGRGDDRPTRKPTAESATTAPAAAPTPAPNEYRTPNTYSVKVFDNYTVNDAKRNRKFSILVRYPVDAPSPMPLIIWSHGGDANNNGHHLNPEWGNTLARAGYAVIHIAHAEDRSDAHCTPLKIPANECGLGSFSKEVSEGGTLRVILYDRPRDSIAVLDDLDNIERAVNIKFDRTRIGTAGHSRGTHGIMSLAGAIIDVSPSVHNLTSADPRFKVFLVNSPQGIGFAGLTKTSWDKITGPMMIATSAADTTPVEPGMDRLDPFRYMPPGDKYQLYIDSPKANHGTFGLGPDGTPELQPYVAANGIAFLDAYLRGLPEAKAWLNSDKMSLWSKGVAKITAK